MSEDHSQTEDTTIHNTSKPIWESRATSPIIERILTAKFKLKLKYGEKSLIVLDSDEKFMAMLGMYGSEKQVTIYVTTENNLGSNNHTNHLCANRDEPHDEYDADLCPTEESYHSHLSSDNEDDIMNDDDVVYSSTSDDNTSGPPFVFSFSYLKSLPREASPATSQTRAPPLSHFPQPPVWASCGGLRPLGGVGNRRLELPPLLGTRYRREASSAAVALPITPLPPPSVKNDVAAVR
ncbi:unnamed protein product [Lactuca virosa]|uniref:PB1 domain-containing protein n=1 Tax=Lactuca virosa TaxID=75947 RepID=A0AAU9LLP4_9ASTR|nr:unnamed protein product [Lactuca virosa]